MELIMITSDKHKVKGTILDTNMVKSLSFNWNERDILIGMCVSLSDGDLVREAKKLMDDYVDRLDENSTDEKVRLYYWHIFQSSFGGETYLQASGNVTGHTRLQDSVNITTSEIQSFCIDAANEECIIQTRNTIYHCL